MPVYSMSSISNSNSWRFLFWENKCIFELDKKKFKKNQLLSNERESTGLNQFNNPKFFTEFSNDIQDVYENI